MRISSFIVPFDDDEFSSDGWNPWDDCAERDVSRESSMDVITIEKLETQRVAELLAHKCNTVQEDTTPAIILFDSFFGITINEEEKDEKLIDKVKFHCDMNQFYTGRHRYSIATSNGKRILLTVNDLYEYENATSDADTTKPAPINVFTHDGSSMEIDESVTNAFNKTVRGTTPSYDIWCLGISTGDELRGQVVIHTNGPSAAVAVIEINTAKSKAGVESLISGFSTYHANNANNTYNDDNDNDDTTVTTANTDENNNNNSNKGDLRYIFGSSSKSTEFENSRVFAIWGGTNDKYHSHRASTVRIIKAAAGGNIEFKGEICAPDGMNITESTLHITGGGITLIDNEEGMRYDCEIIAKDLTHGELTFSVEFPTNVASICLTKMQILPRQRRPFEGTGLIYHPNQYVGLGRGVNFAAGGDFDGNFLDSMIQWGIQFRGFVGSRKSFGGVFVCGAYVTMNADDPDLQENDATRVPRVHCSIQDGNTHITIECEYGGKMIIHSGTIEGVAYPVFDEYKDAVSCGVHQMTGKGDAKLLDFDEVITPPVLAFAGIREISNPKCNAFLKKIGIKYSLIK